MTVPLIYRVHLGQLEHQEVLEIQEGLDHQEKMYDNLVIKSYVVNLTKARREEGGSRVDNKTKQIYTNFT